jgi:two-component system, cell cycle sensor histidine kinase and response regulator CckA
VERANDGVVVVQDEVFKFVNKAWTNTTGFSVEEMMKMSFTEVIPPEHKEMTLRRYRARLAGENPPPIYEGKLLCKDGSLKDVEISASIIEYEGRPANLAVIRNITVRKQAEKVLTFLAQTSGSGPDSGFFESLANYLATNLGMDFVCINRLEKDGLNVKTVAVFRDGRFENNMVYSLKDTPYGQVVGKEVCCFPSGVCQSFPNDVVLQDLQAESYVGVTLWGHTGRPIGIIAVIGRRPLSNPRLAESVLKIVGVRAAAELERQEAEEKRAKLANDLRQAHKMQAIGTLAGGMAHEFNNILGVILGNAELVMLDTPDWSHSLDDLKEIVKASLRARDVVKQLLSFSRIDKVKRIPLKPGPIIKESLQLIRASISAYIEVRQEIEADTYTILADSTQLNQVIINLCTNARDAMKEEGGVLEVALNNVELESQSDKLQPGKYVRLTVRDSGTGIAPETFERIFDPYFTTKEVGEGTGMGLAVVHGIIREHEGVINVNTDPGKGTTFQVYFPAVDEAPRQESRMQPTIPRGTERILLVDDEDSLVRIASGMLERLGYKVEGRTDPEEAVKLFRAEPNGFDLVITDTNMPKMTGDMLAKEIINIRPGMRIVICTGYSERMDKEKAEKLGIKSCVMKPLNLWTIANTVRDVLDEK